MQTTLLVWRCPWMAGILLNDEEVVMTRGVATASRKGIRDKECRATCCVIELFAPFQNNVV